MKKILIFIAFLLPFAGDAQETEGYVRYLLTHNWTKKMEAVDYVSSQRKERLAYIWGSRSEWKSYCNFYFNANETKYEESEEKAEDDDNNYAWRKEAFLLKRDYVNNREYDLMTVLDKAYIIEDTIARPNWKILNDMKEVAGHICMNAEWEDTLKMQKITAWFALDIPISGGPERFCGLPGLILEVDINNGGLLITADKIEMRPLTTELDLPKKLKGKKITEEKYTEMLKKHFEQKKKDEEPPFWGIRY